MFFGLRKHKISLNLQPLQNFTGKTFKFCWNSKIIYVMLVSSFSINSLASFRFIKHKFWVNKKKQEKLKVEKKKSFQPFLFDKFSI